MSILKRGILFFVISLLLLIIIFASCASKKDTAQIKETQPLTHFKSLVDSLTTEEKNIVNDFLDVELTSDRYKNYKNYEIILIEEAGNAIENLLVYEYAYKDFHSYGDEATADDNERLGWILDTTQIKELKNKYNAKNDYLWKINDKAKNDYQWKIADIKNFKVSIMKNDTLRNIINTGKYEYLLEKLIFNITMPLIIDKSSALISFTSSRLGGPNSISHYTALMKKVNGKWQMRASYWDGSF